MEIKQILVTTDFSDNARSAYSCAKVLCGEFGAGLHLAHFAGVLPSVVEDTCEVPFFDIFGGVAGLTPEEAMPLIEDICAGLAYAHAAGLVHSDLKPGNCFFTKEGGIKLLDFGLAGAQTCQPWKTGVPEPNDRPIHRPADRSSPG